MPATETRSRRRPPVALASSLLAALAAVTLICCAAPALSASVRSIVYRGAHVRVPAGWPVVRLDRHPATCVRFDRRVVYLGTPGTAQRCPAHAAGRARAILVTPKARVIRSALGTRSLAAGRAAAMRSAAGASVLGAASPGEVYTGLGFDACATPSGSQMSAWSASRYRAIGVYIGGTNMACAQPNLTASWVSTQSAAGWHLVPIYVGPQAPGNSCGCAAISADQAAAQGQAAAQDAVVDAQSVGLGAGNPLYFDMEGYDHNSSVSATVLAFLGGWTSQLHNAGYLSGVYSSAASGIRDLVSRAGSGYAEPDDLWIANWNSQQSTADANVPASEWPSHQRLHQYRGAHDETYGGRTINIDGDYVDAATAAAGTVTTAATAGPSLRVMPNADGSVKLYPSWRGMSTVSSWQVVAGQAPTGLSAAADPVSVSGAPITEHDAYPYFQVQALDGNGLTLGASPAVATPAHVSIFGNSAFVPRRGPTAIPVGCFGISPCRATVTVTAGSRLARTRPLRIPSVGGLAFFRLTAAGHRRVAQAGHRRLAVTVTVRTSTGASASRRIDLVPYSVSGRGPVRATSASSALRLVSATAFAAGGWTSGVPAACLSTSACRGVTTTVSAAGRVIARSSAGSVGVGQVGYLRFRLTPAGHALLASRQNNQLPVTITATSAGTRATARAVLSAYR